MDQVSPNTVTNGWNNRALPHESVSVHHPPQVDLNEEIKQLGEATSCDQHYYKSTADQEIFISATLPGLRGVREHKVL